MRYDMSINVNRLINDILPKFYLLLLSRIMCINSENVNGYMPFGLIVTAATILLVISLTRLDARVRRHYQSERQNCKVNKILRCVHE